MAKKSVQKTHPMISPELVGKLKSMAAGKSASATLATTRRMQADRKGLVHGGFTFGLADYAAMLAVNEPFVVLTFSAARFIKPVAVGDRLIANAIVVESDGSKKKVWCEVANQRREKVFEGEFLCMVLEKHVLDK
jgi:acyl-coenzyme A thioesterase PaaI-like protein